MASSRIFLATTPHGGSLVDRSRGFSASDRNGLRMMPTALAIHLVV